METKPEETALGTIKEPRMKHSLYFPSLGKHDPNSCPIFGHFSNLCVRTAGDTTVSLGTEHSECANSLHQHWTSVLTKIPQHFSTTGKAERSKIKRHPPLGIGDFSKGPTA